MNVPLDPVTRAKLDAFARRRRRLVVRRGVAATLVAAVVSVTAVAIVDWLVLLPDAVRWALSLLAWGHVLGVCWLLWIRAVLRSPDDRELARFIESGRPELREDLLSAVELGDPASDPALDSPAFRAILQRSVARKVGGLEPEALLPPRLVRAWIGVAAAAVLGFTALFFVPDLRFGRLVTRAVLPMANLARVSRTIVTVVAPDPPDALVPQGDAVPIVASCAGPEPDRVTIEVFREGKARVEIAMEPTGKGTTWSAILPTDENPLSYRIRAGDALTRWYAIATRLRPYVTRFDVVYEHPAYMGRAPRTVSGLKRGDLSAFAGTRATLTLHTDQPVSEGTIEMDQGGKFSRFQAGLSSDGLLEVTIPIEADGEYKVDLRAAETGFDSGKLSPRYEIRAARDELPVVTLEEPAGDQLVPADEIVGVSGTASDDVGLDAIVQVVRVNDGDPVETVLGKRPDLPADPQVRVPVRRDWDLRSLPLRPGDVVTLELAAVDLKGSRARSAAARLTIASEGFSASSSRSVAAARAALDALERFEGTCAEVAGVPRPASRRETGPPAAGLVSRYSLDGTLADSVGGRPGTLVGRGSLQFVDGFDGKHGGALRLDGEQCVVVPRAVAGDMTISCWTRISQPQRRTDDGSQFWQGAGLVEGERPTFTNDAGLAVVGDRPVWGHGRPDYSIAGTESIVLGKWVHVAAVRAVDRTAGRSRLRLYVDGALAAQGEHSFVGALDAHDTFAIGGHVDPSLYLRGDVDEVLFHDRALDAAEVERLARPAGGAAPPPPAPEPPKPAADARSLSMRIASASERIAAAAEALQAALLESARDAEGGPDATEVAAAGAVADRIRGAWARRAGGIASEAREEDAGSVAEAGRRVEEALRQAAGEARELRERYRECLLHDEAAVLREDLVLLERGQQTVGAGERWVRRERAALRQAEEVERRLADHAERYPGRPADEARRAAERLRSFREQVSKGIAALEADPNAPIDAGRIAGPLRQAHQGWRGYAADQLGRAGEARKALALQQPQVAEMLDELAGKAREAADARRQAGSGAAEDREARRRLAALDGARDRLDSGLSEAAQLRASLEDARSDGDPAWASDLGLLDRALAALRAGADDDRRRTALEALPGALRTLEAGHRLAELAALVESLRSHERWSFDSPATVTRQPERTEWGVQLFHAVPDRIREARFPKEAFERLQRLRGGGGWQEVARHMDRRRWTDEPAVRMDGRLAAVSDELSAVKALLREDMAKARELLEDIAPSLSEMMAGLAERAEAMEGRIEDAARPDGDDEPAADEVADLLEDQGALSEGVRDLVDALRRDANLQDAATEAGRERARDADDASAMVERPAEEARRALEESAVAAEAAGRSRALQEAGAREGELADTLRDLAEHYGRLERGEDVAATRAALREAEERLGIAAALEPQFSEAEALSAMERLSPEELLAALEAELGRNDPMRRELGAISRGALDEARRDLARSAGEERGIAERVGASIREEAGRPQSLAERLASVGSSAAELSEGPVREASRRAERAGVEDSSALEQASGGLDAAARAAGEDGLDTPAEIAKAARDAAGLLAEAAERLEAAAGASERAAGAAREAGEAAGREAEASAKAAAEARSEASAARERSEAAGVSPDEAREARETASARDGAAAEAERAAAEAGRAAEAARRAEGEASRARDGAAEAAPRAEALAAEAGRIAEEATRMSSALAEGAARQEPIAGAVDGAAETIDRASRHEERLGNEAAGEALGELAEGVRGVADGAVPRAGRALREGAPEPGRAAVEGAREAIDARIAELDALAAEGSPVRGSPQEGASPQGAAAQGAPEPGSASEAASRQGGASQGAAARGAASRGGGEPGSPQEGAMAATQGGPPSAAEGAAGTAGAGGEEAAPGSGEAPSGPGSSGETGPSLARALDQLDRALFASPAGDAASGAPASAGTDASASAALEDARGLLGQASSSLARGMRQGRGAGPGPATRSPGAPRSEGFSAVSRGGAQVLAGPSAPGAAIPALAPRTENRQWGKLPPKLARDLIEGQRERVAEEYRAMVETYFRVLAETARKESP